MIPASFRPAAALALAAGLALPLTGCDGGSPYEAENAEATEGTGETPAGALNRALDPGDAGVVGEGNVSDDADPDQNERELGDPGRAGGEAAGDPLSAKPVSYDQFAETVAGLKGDVVLVDCWATWCDPCREAFPHTVKLGRQHTGEGLKVVTLAFNAAEEQDEVDRFLASQNAGRLVNLRTDDGGDSAAWNPMGDLGLPTYIVYDRDGEEVARFSGTTEADAGLDAAVRNALGR